MLFGREGIFLWATTPTYWHCQKLKYFSGGLIPLPFYKVKTTSAFKKEREREKSLFWKVFFWMGCCPWNPPGWISEKWLDKFRTVRVSPWHCWCSLWCVTSLTTPLFGAIERRNSIDSRHKMLLLLRSSRWPYSLSSMVSSPPPLAAASFRRLLPYIRLLYFSFFSISLPFRKCEKPLRRL